MFRCVIYVCHLLLCFLSPVVHYFSCDHLSLPPYLLYFPPQLPSQIRSRITPRLEQSPASSDSIIYNTPSSHCDKAAVTPCTPSLQTVYRKLVSYLPAPVLKALQSRSLSNLAEIRTVTTLFLKLDSFDLSNDYPVNQLQDFFFEMQKCLFDCGGVLRQFLVDDKGCVLIGLWGVPTASHPANTSRAIRCSLMMKKAAAALRELVSIGISTGSVYCGTIGTKTR